jgi:hypothetical protein
MQDNPFSDLQASPAEHFRLCFYGAVLRLIAHLTPSLGSFEEVFKHFPFLGAYSDEIAARGVAGLSVEAAGDWWSRSIETWEEKTSIHLPLRALCKAAQIDRTSLELILCAGLAEEDSRFGDVFEALQAPPGQRRPTFSLLSSLQDERSRQQERGTDLRQLVGLGLLQVLNPEAPRSEWALQVPTPLWDALRGGSENPLAPWLRFAPASEAKDLKEVICSESHRKRFEEVPPALASSSIRTVVVRGPQRNGRRTVLRGIAKALSLGSLEVAGLIKADDERWRILGPLATALHAMPVVALELSPGETAALPPLTAYDGPLGIVLGRHGGVSGPWTERSVAVSVDLPDQDERLAHWAEGSGSHRIEEPRTVAERYRMTSGNIRRAASIAVSYASLNGRASVEPSDIQQAMRSLNREILDSFAEHVETSGEWSHLAVPPHTLDELRNLEARCRHREPLRSSVPPVLGGHLNTGVRALLTGPSGTGKSLAARLLAASLRMDLYRINLGTVVNKYIGETEKNLNLILSRAEELPVILLLDEGDALLTQRTHVQTANDRYANLETNFLLQRLESFEGIIIVTTNAGDRIDSAFARRMDVVIDFRAPDSAERWAIWNMFLPENNSVNDRLLSEIVTRCSLTGAQIRNAVLHASLVALGNGGIVTSDYVEAAVRREYRKLGAACPLRPSDGS